MQLHELARGVPGATIEGSGDVEITGIAYDSRRVKAGDLFVAVEGLQGTATLTCRTQSARARQRSPSSAR